MNDPVAALPSWSIELLRQARVARLGMVDGEGCPRVLPVTFVLHEGEIWTAVDAKPKRERGSELARVRYLRERPAAAITADVYSDDWERLAWVQVLGEAAVLDAPEHSAPLEALAGKYEQYRREPPPGPLIRIRPRRALSWRAANVGA